MAQVNELNAVAVKLFAVLSASSIIRAAVGKHPTLDVWQVYEVSAPQDSTYPCIIFNPIFLRYSRYTAGRKSHGQFYYQVEAINTGDSYSELGPIADEIENLLYQSQVVDDPVIMGMSVTRPIQFSEYDDGTRYNHLGSVVEIFASKQG